MPIKTTTLFSYLENRLVDFTVNEWYKLENKTIMTIIDDK